MGDHASSQLDLLLAVSVAAPGWAKLAGHHHRPAALTCGRGARARRPLRMGTRGGGLETRLNRRASDALDCPAKAPPAAALVAKPSKAPCPCVAEAHQPAKFLALT